MVEDIITGLSRSRSLFVIARNSTLTYKGQAVDIKQVGRHEKARRLAAIAPVTTKLSLGDKGADEPRFMSTRPKPSFSNAVDVGFGSLSNCLFDLLR